MTLQHDYSSKIKTILEDATSDLHLYLITRTEEGKIYTYNADRIDFDDEVKNHIKDGLCKRVKKYSNSEKYQHVEYSVISDDLKSNIFYYDVTNNPFTQSITDLIPAQPTAPQVSNLKKYNQNIWATCVYLTNKDSEQFYLFKKYGKSKIVTDEPQQIKEKLFAIFDSSDAQLQPLKTSALIIENNFDFILVDKIAYIFSKYQFETIVGIESEFKEKSETIINKLKDLEVIQGLDYLKEKVESNKILLRRMANIFKKQGEEGISEDLIDEIHSDETKEFLRNYEGKELKSNDDNKIIIENHDDIDLFLKLIDDFYKQAIVTKKIYGTYNGEILNKQ